MALSAGNRIGQYEILAQIGAGGMGEVYRAKDTTLKCEVALKVLPDAFAHDPARMARFQREAEVLARLNHPHISAIYGVSEAAGDTGRWCPCGNNIAGFLLLGAETAPANIR